MCMEARRVRDIQNFKRSNIYTQFSKNRNITAKYYLIIQHCYLKQIQVQLYQSCKVGLIITLLILNALSIWYARTYQAIKHKNLPTMLKQLKYHMLLSCRKETLQYQYATELPYSKHCHEVVGKWIFRR